MLLRELISASAKFWTRCSQDSFAACVLHAALCVLLLPHAAFAQQSAARSAPHVVDAGDPASGVIARGAFVAWDYWTVAVNGCRLDVNGGQCTIPFANGDSNAHALCIGMATLLSSASDSVTATILAPKGVITFMGPEDSQCIKIGAHESVPFLLRSSAVMKSRALLVWLFERTNESASGTILRAHAKVPIAGPLSR